MIYVHAEAVKSIKSAAVLMNKILVSLTNKFRKSHKNKAPFKGFLFFYENV
jgi:hypothetical protein